MSTLTPNSPETSELEFHLQPRQYEVFHCAKRFRVVVAGRRFGKTELALAELVRAAKLPNTLAWYVGPTKDLAKEIIWRRLKSVTRHLWAKKPLEQDLRIDLQTGSAIIVKSGFKPDNLRGTGLDFLVIDEAAALKADPLGQKLSAPLSPTAKAAPSSSARPKAAIIYTICLTSPNPTPMWLLSNSPPPRAALSQTANSIRRPRHGSRTLPPGTRSPNSPAVATIAPIIAFDRTKSHASSFSNQSAAHLVHRFQCQPHVHAPHAAKRRNRSRPRRNCRSPRRPHRSGLRTLFRACSIL